LRINEYSDLSTQEAINVRTGLIIPEWVFGLVLIVSSWKRDNSVV
jgi:hypothetical protein